MRSSLRPGRHPGKPKQVILTLIQNPTIELNNYKKFVNIRTRKVQSQESSFKKDHFRMLSSDVHYICTIPTPRNDISLYKHMIFHAPSQSIVTTAPNAFIDSIIFSDSSFGTPSFICFGAPSTNFLLSTKLKPSILLISLITFGFAAASNDLSVRVKSVFSWAAGAATSSSTGAAAAAGAAGPAAKLPMGISGILRRDCTGPRLVQ